jgi:hypothetical protein
LHFQKKNRRLKGAISLFCQNDERLVNYDRETLMKILNDNRYHSLEDSETDAENPSAKRKINVYNPSWRSEEVR